MPSAWSPCPRYGLRALGMVSKPSAWSLCSRHGLCALGMVAEPLAWSPCPWHGLHAIGMETMHGLHALDIVSVPLVWSPSPQCASCALSMLPVPSAWSPCLWRGLHAFGVVSVPSAWSPCFGMVSMPPGYSITTACILAFFAFSAFFSTLTLELCYGQTGDPRILRTVPNKADMCWVLTLSKTTLTHRSITPSKKLLKVL